MRQIATTKEILKEARGDGSKSPEQQLELLISRFCEAAYAVDPSIKKMWVGRGGEGLDQPFFISIERDEGASCIRRGSKASTQ